MIFNLSDGLTYGKADAIPDARGGTNYPWLDTAPRREQHGRPSTVGPRGRTCATPDTWRPNSKCAEVGRARLGPLGSAAGGRLDEGEGRQGRGQREEGPGLSTSPHSFPEAAQTLIGAYKIDPVRVDSLNSNV